jgi:hypothetical protein
VCALVALVLLVGACSSDDPTRGDDGRIVNGGDLSVFDLVPGDCVVLADDLEAVNETLPVVPCEEPHQAEVYALVEVDDLDAYPGERELSDRAELECLDEFADYVGVDLVDSTLFFTYMIPSVRGWQEEQHRTVVCLVVAAGRPIEGSVAGSGL